MVLTFAECTDRLRALAANAERASEVTMDPGRAKALDRDASAWRLIAYCLDDLNDRMEAL